jgi:hypothetical protein
MAKNNRTTRSIAFRLFLTCWLIYTLHFATNTVREIYPALSLVEHLSFDVTDYLGLHPDIFEIPGRGAYINNNPGASILGAAPYALTYPLTHLIVEKVQAARQRSGNPVPEYNSIYPMAREFFQQAYQRGYDIKFGLAAGVMQALLMAPLSALSVVVMFRILASRLKSNRPALLLALLFAFATPIFYRTAQLNHNLLQADFALFAFALLWRPWDDPAQPKQPHYFLAGLLAGWTVVLDYSGVVIILALAIYTFFKRKSLPKQTQRKMDLPWFGLGVLLCGLILAGYQWLAFGSPFYPAQQYMPATTYSAAGYQGISLPQLDLLWENAFGKRYGLFVSAPILLLVWLFPLWLPKKRRLIGDRQTTFVVCFTLAFFLFTAANQYSRMQFNSGVRHMLPVVPFVFLLVATVLVHLPQWLAITLGVFSTYWSWSLAMYRDVEQGQGIIESIRYISTHGPQLPWLETLHRLGYLDFISSWFIILPVLLVIGLIWLLPVKGKT